MDMKLLYDEGIRMFAVVFQSGDEVSEGLLRFAGEHRVTSAGFTAIGAFSRVTLAFFDPEKKEYEEIPVEQQVEVLMLAGNIANYKGQPRVHAHVIVGLRDGSTRGGHLMDATVRPTLEVLVTETPGHLRRRVDAETGLPLIDPHG